jgi:hypothetical protein
MAAAGAGILVFVVVVVLAAFLCRRTPEASESSLVEEFGLMAEAEGTVPIKISGELAGHQFDNPLADTLVGTQDTLYGDFAE